MKNSKFSIILTTTSSKKEANFLSKKLLNKKLAACIQINKIKSYYTWKDKVCIDREFRLLIKSKTKDFSKIKKFIISNHPYEVPEIIQIPITNGSKKYLNWIEKETTIE